jgi:hypothetical protein
MQYTRLEGLVLGSVLAALGDGLVIPKMQELGMMMMMMVMMMRMVVMMMMRMMRMMIA